MIEGAITYAERLGFAPHHDFRKTRRVLGGIDAAACPENFSFGYEGRPRFVAGPDDSAERIDRVLGILRARCGEDGFDYVAPDDESDMADDVGQEMLEATPDYLRGVLDGAGPPTPSFRELCGILGAISAGSDWGQTLDALIEGLAARFVPELRGEERKQFVSSVGVQLLRTAADFIEADRSPVGEANPIQLVDVAEGDKSDGGCFVIEWCRGFLRATELWPEAWSEPLARADLAPHFDLIRAWARPEAEDNVALIQQTNADSRSLPAAMLTLYRALRLQGRSVAPRDRAREN